MTEQPESGSEDLGAVIDSVCAPLKQHASYAHDQATILLATYETSTREEYEAFATQCTTLGQEAADGAQHLLAAGVQDWVYSVKACHDLAYWANSAAGHGTAAAASGSPSEIHGIMSSAVNDLLNGMASINGA